MIIEQAKILTTHNLAVLFDALGLTRTLRPRLPELARRCFERVFRLLLRDVSRYQHRLRNVKNAAYAWRQMVFFLSLRSKSEQEACGHWAQQHLDPHRGAVHTGAHAASRGDRRAGFANAWPGVPWLGRWRTLALGKSRTCTRRGVVRRAVRFQIVPCGLGQTAFGISQCQAVYGVPASPPAECLP
ncbi:hypothetical protein [Myxococcus sp. AM010]|uniref:hypothetical protein n=1 Tax=Myxococcus sp. AM010 TaxID=2745138 RepID=UPI0020D1168F|nr:hypothetical protein [Myxococcus sp. AM010]